MRQTIKFTTGGMFYAELSNLTSGDPRHITVKFENKVPDRTTLLSGFDELNEHNMHPQGDFHDMTHIYKEEDGGMTFILTSSSDDVYVEPIPEPEPPTPTEATITFVADENCTLDGVATLTLPIGTDLSGVVSPKVTPIDMEYEFTGWSPAIEGTLYHDITFMAISALKTEYTLESRITLLENSLLELTDMYYESIEG